MIYRRLLLSLCTIFAFACGPDGTQYDESDIDGACFNMGQSAGMSHFIDSFDSHEAGRPIEEGESIDIVVGWYQGNDYLENEHESCSVELVGNEIRVTARASWELAERDYLDHAYTATATCITPPLPAGQYLVILGDYATPLTVPSEPMECVLY